MLYIDAVFFRRPGRFFVGEFYAEQTQQQEKLRPSFPQSLVVVALRRSSPTQPNGPICRRKRRLAESRGLWLPRHANFSPQDPPKATFYCDRPASFIICSQNITRIIPSLFTSTLPRKQYEVCSIHCRPPPRSHLGFRCTRTSAFFFFFFCQVHQRTNIEVD